MQPISIIIPTYTAYEYLELCLESIYQNQHNKDNEIIIIVDGTYDLNKHIIDAYKTKLNLNPIVFNENVGFALATNYGFYNSLNALCLMMSDDNVVPEHFDKKLTDHYKPNTLLVPNQIEPKGPSMFKSFIIKDLGKNTKEFDLEIFNNEEKKLRKNLITDDGWTLPFFINKYDYLRVGGMDPYYNSAHVVDWELFLKLQMSGIQSHRLHMCNFYHFGSMSARTPDSYEKERQAHEYAKLKWGEYIKNDPETNKKFI